MTSPNNGAVRIEGLNLLVRNLRKVSKELPPEMKEIHRKLGEPIARKAASKVRSRSGRLAASVKSAPTQRLARISAGTRLKYAGVNHYGGYPGDYKGNPFLTEAINENESFIANEYDRLIGVFVERVWQDNFL